MPHFECGAFNHSATSPWAPNRGQGPGGRGRVIGEDGWSDKAREKKLAGADRTARRPGIAMSEGRPKKGGTAIRKNTLAVPCRLIAMPAGRVGVSRSA